MSMIVTSLKTGTVFQEDGQPFLVLKYEHIKVSRGSANVKVKARNLITGQVLEKGFIASAKIDEADIYRKNAQYLYNDGTAYVFMDPDTFEQVSISADTLGDSARFLLEGQKVQILYFDGNPISVDLPITMVFEITETVPGYKGNTVTNVLKEATIQNGTVVKVPPFIKVGDKVKIDTRTGDYSSKA